MTLLTLRRRPLTVESPCLLHSALPENLLRHQAPLTRRRHNVPTIRPVAASPYLALLTQVSNL